MKRKLIRNKKVRYGLISALLVVMIVVVAILVNMVASAVVERYSLYTSMVDSAAFDITDDCYTFLDGVFRRAEEQNRDTSVQILFCNTEEKINSDTSTTYYIYHTADALSKRYPDRIEVKCLDIVANPKPVEPYAVTKNPLTGEDIEITIYSDSIIVVADGYHRVYGASEFFVYSEDDTSTPWAYSGEKKLASAIMNALSGEERMVGFLNNHGETFFDYEMVNLLNDAGYTVVYLDLYKDPIPENCELLISYNPNSDLLTKEQDSDISETDILNAFLAEDGHSFFVFLESGTPSLPNFEGYLAEWGVDTQYDRNEKTGAAYRYMVEDAAESLTTDGYTIYGEAAEGDDEFVDAEHDYVVFRNATALAVTGEGYRSNGDGGYVSTDGRRTLHPIYYSRAEARSWANGRVVDDGSAMLMSVTEQSNGGDSTSYVGVVSSVEFATLRYLQSPVYGNADVILHLLEQIGGGMNTEGLSVKPFLVEDISTVTTHQILTWTILLAVIPTVIFTGCGIVILVRRRHAR